MRNEITKEEELNHLGWNLAQAGKLQEALEYFEQAEKINPNYLDTYMNRGRTYAALENYKKAAEDFSRILLVEKRNAQALFHLANMCYMMKDYRTGIIHAQSAAEAGYEETSLYCNLGKAYEEIGDDDKALRNYNRAIVQDPLEGNCYIHKARLLVKNRKFEEALETLAELNHYCPDSYESYHYTFLIYMQMGEFTKADAVITSGIEAFPADVSLYYDKLRILNIAKEFEDALELIELLQELPGYSLEARNIQLEKARIHLQMEKIEEAVKVLEEVIQMEGARTFEAHYLLMNTYLAMGRYEDTIRIARIMIEADDESEFARSAHYYLPMALLKMGDKAQSTLKYRDAIQKMRYHTLKYPQDLDAYLFRALCHKDLGEQKKAMEILEYAEKLAGEYAPIHQIKSFVYQDMGDSKRADQEMKLAKEAGTEIGDVLDMFIAQR